MRRLIIAASVAVVLMISAIALVVINANDTATALQTETTQPQTETRETTQPQTETTEPEIEVPLPEFMEEHLQDLVERGFVTQEQLDEMEGWFRGHGPWNGELPDVSEHRRFMGDGFGPHGFGFFGGDEDLADMLGVTPEELLDALSDGTPLTDIIDNPEAIVDSMVGLMEEQLKQAVEAGSLTQEEADELIAEARSHAEAFVGGEAFEGKGFMGRQGPGGFHGFGHFGPHPGEDANAEAARYSV